MINIHSHKTAASTFSTVVNLAMNEDHANQIEGYFSAGIHPWYITNLGQQKTQLSKKLEDNNCIAVGECGLDKVCSTDLNLQIDVFNYQCGIAKTCNKPMIIHCVKAHFDTIEILKQNGISRAIFHGFNNRYTILEKILQEGYFVSFGEALLNPRSQAAALLKMVPTNMFFLETDESELPIENIYSKAAEICEVEITQLINQQALNFNNFIAK